jgi:hypothetical protein
MFQGTKELIGRAGSVAGEILNERAAGCGQADVTAPPIVGVGLTHEQRARLAGRGR